MHAVVAIASRVNAALERVTLPKSIMEHVGTAALGLLDNIQCAECAAGALHSWRFLGHRTSAEGRRRLHLSVGFHDFSDFFFVLGGRYGARHKVPLGRCL